MTKKNKPIPAEAIIDCTASVQFECAGDGVPKAEIIAYTGGKMRPKLNGKTSPLPVVVDLATANIEAGAIPLIYDHDHKSLLGHAGLRIADNQILASGEFSAVGSEVDRVVKMSKRGFPWQASLGFVGDAFVIDKGKQVHVNGALQDGPFILMKNAKFRELSILGIAADPNTSVQIAAAGANLEELVNMTLNQDASGNTPAVQASAQVVDVQAAAAEAQKAVRDATIAETKRLSELRAVAGDNAELLVTAIEAGWSVDLLKDKVELANAKKELEAIRAARPVGGVAIHASGAQVDNRIVSAAILREHGMSDAQIEAAYGADIAQKSHDRRFRGYGLKRLMHEVLVQAGKSCPIGAEDNDFIQEVFAAEQRIQATGAPSTLSLTSVLLDAANKRLISAYNRTNSIVPFAFARRNAKDFKKLYGVKLEGTGILEEIGADGEIKHASLSDSEYTIQLETYAKMLGISRKMMINDDLGAFLRVAQILGDMAFKAHEKAAAETMLDTDLYDSSNSQTGAISLANIAAMYNKFLAQTDADGYPITVMPDRMLTASGLALTARSMLNSEFIQSGNTTNQPDRNPVYGIVNQVVGSAWLANANVTNYSATVHFMLCDPNERAAFAVAYLNGKDTPTIESSEMNFNKLGMEFRCYFDFAFGTEDKVGVVKSSGA